MPPTNKKKKFASSKKKGHRDKSIASIKLGPSLTTVLASKIRKKAYNTPLEHKGPQLLRNQPLNRTSKADDEKPSTSAATRKNLIHLQTIKRLPKPKKLKRLRRSNRKRKLNFSKNQSIKEDENGTSNDIQLSSSTQSLITIDSDCICIEDQVEHITIDDDDDGDKHMDGNGNETLTYKSLLGDEYSSFANQCASTPLPNNAIPSTIFYDDTNSTQRPPPNISEIEYNTINCKWLQENSVDRVTTTNRSEEIGNTNCIFSDVIVLDETYEDPTLKMEENTTDDSVIFVSETKPNEFIPITTHNDAVGTSKSPGSQKPQPSPSLQRQYRNNKLFTSSEIKQLHAYNTNAYNPNASTEVLTGKRMILIDGSNLAYHHGLNKEFSVKGITICVDFFSKLGHDVKAVVPQSRLRRNQSSDPNELERLHKAGKLIFTPSKSLPGKSSASYDDRLILQLACELDAVVISNDNFRDLLHENPAFKKVIENRVVGYTWCADVFILPKDPYGRWGPTLDCILNRS